MIYGSPTVPRLFLIDGSSQMYRAYHAIRGLTGPDGRSTNAVYGFVDDAAQAHRRSPAGATSRRRSTWRARRSATISSADYKANRAPMPSDLVEQVPLVHEACEALGVPILTLRALRGRRRDRHAGDAGAGGRLRRGASSPATRTSSSSSTTASASTTRATRAPGTTPAAWSRSSACDPTRSSTCWR